MARKIFFCFSNHLLIGKYLAELSGSFIFERLIKFLRYPSIRFDSFRSGKSSRQQLHQLSHSGVGKRKKNILIKRRKQIDERVALLDSENLINFARVCRKARSRKKAHEQCLRRRNLSQHQPQAERSCLTPLPLANNKTRSRIFLC